MRSFARCPRVRRPGARGGRWTRCTAGGVSWACPPGERPDEPPTRPRRLRGVWQRPPQARLRGRKLWTAAADVALLWNLPHDEVARRVGRTVEGVRVKRAKLGIPTARERRIRD